MEQIALDWAPRRRQYLSVSEFVEALRGIIDDQFGSFWLSGEISGCKLSPAGHYYFTLKDDRAQLRCACFKGSARFLKFKPRDGVAVLARGRADVYAERGDLQFIVEAIEPQGFGALQFAFEQLKKKLAGEGLFEATRKRPLPKLPRRIGLVTSPSGAVIRDMINVLGRRFPGLHIRLYPALVQGEGSVEAVCRGLEYFSRVEWAEVVIVARGGGSLEDLWTFNEEAVARAIAGSRVPVISAVGHETDFTIADFVADLRAPTPSAAAEMVICTRAQLLESIRGCEQKLVQALRWRTAQAGRVLHQRGADRIAALFHRLMARRSQRLDELDFRLRRQDVGVRFGQMRQRLESAQRQAEQILRSRFGRARTRLGGLERRLRDRDLGVSVARARHRLESAEERLRGAMVRRLERSASNLGLAAARLDQLSPLRILERGYAIVEDSGGRVIKSAAEAAAGDEVRVRLGHGELDARVTATRPKP